MSSEEKEQLIKNSSIKDGQRSLDKINADLRLLKIKWIQKGAAYDLDTVSGQIKRLETKKTQISMAMNDIEGKVPDNVTKIENRMLANGEDKVKSPINIKNQTESTAETVARIQKYDTGSFKLRDKVLNASDIDMKAAKEVHGFKATAGRSVKNVITNPKFQKKALKYGGYGLLGAGAVVTGAVLFELCTRRGQQSNSELYGQQQMSITRGRLEVNGQQITWFRKEIYK